MSWLENALYLLAWPLVLILSLFAVAGLLHVAGWWLERRQRANAFNIWKDAMLYGHGFSRNGKHIPYKKIYKETPHV